MAADFAKALGVHLEDMVDVYPTIDSDAQKIKVLHSNQKVSYIFNIIRRMPDAELDFLIRMVDYMQATKE